MIKLVITLFFLILTSCILTHSKISLYYAFMGLTLWFEKMIPALLPFMMLSSIMVRMRLTEGFTSIIYPLIRPIYRVSRNVCYAMLMGFLCGFPMGAKTIQELYLRQMISLKEAEYLLAFCNNIGPVYFIGFVLPLLNRQLLVPYLIGMYGLPLLYGLVLRYTHYRDMSMPPVVQNLVLSNSASNRKGIITQLFTEIDDAITSSVQSILLLGGYMILFNLLNLLPHILLGDKPILVAPLFEISGGLYMLQDQLPIYTLLLLPFGGFSCIAQTYSCIKNTPLSIADYTFHKLVLMGLTAIYYLGWLWVSPNSFLR